MQGLVGFDTADDDGANAAKCGPTLGVAPEATRDDVTPSRRQAGLAHKDEGDDAVCTGGRGDESGLSAGRVLYGVKVAKSE